MSNVPVVLSVGRKGECIFTTVTHNLENAVNARRALQRSRNDRKPTNQRAIKSGESVNVH